ncbi:MAG: glycosyltransferase family 2 protein [Methylocystis sp.]
MVLLSIISPFYNSEHKCKRLLDTIACIDDSLVEIILVDDGSTDSTMSLLQQFQQRARTKTNVLSQDNRGPGGARNTGCLAARGKYVWFVDSDDNISIDAIDFLKLQADNEFDFIDFDIVSNGQRENSMSLSPGSYFGGTIFRDSLIDNFGRIWSKIIRRDFIVNNKIFYPEFCIYEDNALGFIYPLFVHKFYKADVVGYMHNTEFDSVTRSTITPRYFDRLHTAVYGIQRSYRIARDTDRARFKVKFIRLYLINTIGQALGRFPNRHWISICYVMKFYRQFARDFDIKISPFSLIAGSYKFRAVIRSLWLLSYLLPEQPDYFTRMRLRSWGRPINFVE